MAWLEEYYLGSLGAAWYAKVTHFDSRLLGRPLLGGPAPASSGSHTLPVLCAAQITGALLPGMARGLHQNLLKIE
jgi:hypothetical protein